MKVHIIGPSGVGKTYILEQLRAAKLACVFDLDTVGYRLKGEDWKSWTINTAIYQLLSENAEVSKQDYFVAGCDSHTDKTIKASKKAGFIVVALIPSVKTIELNRRARGDKLDKISESAESHRSWSKHAAAHKLRVFESSDELIENYFPGATQGFVL